jgi:hypothetical protein
MATKQNTKPRGPAKRGVVLSASIPPELSEEIDAAVEALNHPSVNRSRVGSMLLQRFAGRVETEIRSVILADAGRVALGSAPKA